MPGTGGNVQRDIASLMPVSAGTRITGTVRKNVINISLVREKYFPSVGNIFPQRGNKNKI
jgi:hypothetical protein